MDDNGKIWIEQYINLSVPWFTFMSVRGTNMAGKPLLPFNLICVGQTSQAEANSSVLYCVPIN